MIQPPAAAPLVTAGDYALTAAVFVALGAVSFWLPGDGWSRLLPAVAGLWLCWRVLAGIGRRRRAPAGDPEPTPAPGPVAPTDAELETRARIRALLDTATEGIVMIDLQGRIELLNSAAQRMFGYPAEDLLGRNVKCLMGEPHTTLHDGYLSRYLSTGERRIIGIGREVEGRRKDGSMFPIDLSVGEGTIAGRRFFTAIIRDVTERKEMQAKLAQAERLAAVGELAAGVAHEVNNPINTIINCAQLIADGDTSDDHGRTIREEGARIAEIVRDLLQFARGDQDRPQATSVPEVIERTLRLIGENLKRHGIKLVLEVPDGLPQARSRPQQLQQVLLNLLINAKDAMLGAAAVRPLITLRVAAEAGGVALCVADNGPGIDPAVQQRIFEPFVTTKRARGGTGLGLSVSRSIVEGYGGTIEARSESGKGAEFRIWLPLATET